MIDAGVLIRDDKPCYYVYRLTWRGHVETGLAAVASLADYATNRIRKHEQTTPAKEDDRVRQIEAVNAQTGPVMLGYPTAPQIDALLARGRRDRHAAVDVTADDGVRHQLWVIADDARIAALTRAVDALPALYIADGHHRSAAAARVAKARGGEGSHQLFPRRAVSAGRNDDPRLQSRAAGFERPHARRAAGANCASATRSRRAISRCGRPRRRARHVSCRTLVPSDAALGRGGRGRADRRPDRPAADHAVDAQHHRADFRHHRSAHRQAHRLRRRRARARRAGAAACRPAKWRSRSRSIRRR